MLEDPPLFSAEYPEAKRTIAYKLFTASKEAIEDSSFNGNFLNYWLKTATEFFREYTGPFSQQIFTFVVRSYKKANPGEPVEIAFVPIAVKEMLRGLNYYDPRFGAAFFDGAWNGGFDHAEAIQKIQCPTILIQANFDVMKDGTLNGAMTEDQAKRAVSLIKSCEYKKVNAGHVVNLEVPGQFIRIIDGFFSG